MDCLDRTNVVQAALARHIMEQQVSNQIIIQTKLTETGDQTFSCSHLNLAVHVVKKNTHTFSFWCLLGFFFFFQLKKLGKQLPDQILPAPIRTAFQEMWASNGDAISRQYAGTAAMKVPRGKLSSISVLCTWKSWIFNLVPRVSPLSFPWSGEQGKPWERGW